MGDRKKRVSFTCSNCGKVFWENSAQARKRMLHKQPEIQNCSKACYADWRHKIKVSKEKKLTAPAEDTVSTDRKAP